MPKGYANLERPVVFNYEKDDVILPEISVGVCVNWRKCKNIDPLELGNGYCVNCWDRKVAEHTPLKH